MIVIFGKEGCRKTFVEKKMLETRGYKFIYYDIDTKEGKQEANRRGLAIKKLRHNTPWVINDE